MIKRLKKIIFILILVLMSGGFAHAQKIKKQGELFEYQSVLYNAVSQEVCINMKTNSGQLKQFIYNANDVSKIETILFKPVNSLTGNSNILSKPELIGVKYSIEFTSLNGSLPEGNCCFKITALSAL